MDIILPDGNEAGIVEMAKRLGITDLLALYPVGKLPKGSACGCGVVCTAAEVDKALSAGGPVAVLSSEKDRAVFERRNAPAYIIGLGESPLSDRMHQRETGLNAPLLHDLKRTEAVVVLSVRSLLSCEGMMRARLLGRWMEIVRLCRKLGVPVVVASCADRPEGLRSEHDRRAIGSLVGL